MSNPNPKIINLFNPNAVPFGQLSNNSYHPMTINGKKYETVTNYIYSNMLTTPILRSLVQHAKIKAVGGVNKELMTAIDYLLEEKDYNIQSGKYKKEIITVGGQKRVFYKEVGKQEEHKQKEEKDEKKYQDVIARRVRKPFESVDLKQLKAQMEAESAIKQMGIYQLYNQSKEQELFDVINSAVHKGYEVRFKDPQLQRILLDTENYPIVYKSRDRFLGDGEDGKGYNLVGRNLMQIRHNLRIQSIEKDKEEEKKRIYGEIYDTYKAYVFLRSELMDNNNQLKEYLGLSPKQIIDRYGSTYKKGFPTEETVITMYNRDQLNPIVMKSIHRPGTLVVNVRKTGIRQLRDKMIRYSQDIIFNSYLEYMIEKNYEDLSKDQIGDAIAQQKASISPIKLEKIKERVIDLFKLGMLSASLSDRIDKEIEQLDIPSEDEVKETELVEIAPEVEEKEIKEENSSSSSSSSKDSDPVTKMMKKMFKEDRLKKDELINMIIAVKGGNKEDYKDWSKKDLQKRLDALDEDNWRGQEKKTKEHKSSDLYKKPSGQPIDVFEDDVKNLPEIRPFNPSFFTGMLSINNNSYPTIQHYIITRLIASTGTEQKVDSFGITTIKKGMGISNAYKLVLVDPNRDGSKPEDFLTIYLAGKVYDEKEEETNIMLLSLYTATSLNKKFEDRSLQDLLLLTGNAKIKWNSPQNFYLGAGTKDHPGRNYVGETMMDIREKLRESREDEEEIDIEVKDIVKLVSKDDFVLSWVKMRTKDMCNVVYKFQQYLKIKDNITIDLSEKEILIRLVTFVLDVVYQPCTALSGKISISVPEFFTTIVSKCRMSLGESSKIYSEDGWKYNKETLDHIKAIEQQITQLEMKYDESFRNNHSKQEGEEFNKNQREEWSEFMNKLNKSDISQQKKLKTMDDFKLKQEQDYNAFWGIVPVKPNKIDEIKHNNQIKRLKREISKYKEKVEKSDAFRYDTIKEISQIYWNRIAIMLGTLIKNINQPSSSNIRSALLEVEMLVSQNMNCVRIIEDEKENCIVSALLNLLTGIKEFKETFSTSPDLDEDDVKLAGSIILNSNIDYTIIHPEEIDSDVEEEKFDIDEGGVFPSEKDEPEFGFKWGMNGTKYVNIEQQVFLISNNNSEVITDEIIKQIEVIKDSKVPSKIKQNRINFFATIR